ncbi:MAG: ABC-F family ATP-binding cassette domain-containing protein [Bacteroidia bacterium]|nr:ABC-F family ATP-binding cassette domain-containing protein [Bacteroidia bacterium]
MLTLNNITFDFGSRVLYQNANWHIKPGERIGLVGRNGTGKSTLLRIITEDYAPTGGSISKHKDLTIGFFNQDLLSLEINDSVLNLAMSAFSRQMQLIKEIDEIIAKLEYDHSDRTIQQMTDKQQELDHLDGYSIQAKAEEVLEGLGFKTAELQKPYKQFSGGWRMRAMLAKLILQNPDLLLLDEPTNHLDLPSIEWLEEYLEDYEGTVIIVSHDRYFLDRMVTKIAEVEYQRINLYTGNYSDYLIEKSEREELQQARFENQQKILKQQERFIERFRSKASKATAVQSRVKMLQKIERVEAVQKNNANVHFNFNFSQASGKIVEEFKNVSKSYGDLDIVRNATINIERGDKIALIGANGLGKSTILRMIDDSEPFSGEIIHGYNVKQAFFAQHQLESLKLNNNLLDELLDHAPMKTENELRTVLGCFLFTGEDVFKKIKVLSGGEKSRVALAKVLLSDANFLLLDEPSNHLDMQAVNILISALQDYKGSLLFISHDRYFISKVANKIWYIENKELKEYPGTYLEYEEWMLNRKWNEREELSKTGTKKPTVVEQKPVVEVNDTKEKQKVLKKLNNEFTALEESIQQVTEQKKEMEMVFTQPEVSNDGNKLRTLQMEYDALNTRLAEMNVNYEQLFNRIVELENELQQVSS